jgi:type VI secretion system protein ImpC
MLLARIIGLDRLLSAQLARIMHAPEFQQLEAAWRGLEYLVSRIQSDGPVQIRVLSVTKKELLRDVQRAPEFDQSALFKKVYEDEYGTLGGEPFAVLIGDYYFDASPEDVELLEKISAVAAAAHAPFLAGAGRAMFNMDSFTQLAQPRSMAKIFEAGLYAKWNTFRTSDNSRYAALVLPRILLRSPYGAAMPVQPFEFDEFLDGRSHSSYLWGNPAYALAARFTEAFETYGWCAAVRGEEGGQVRGLPLHHIIGDEGEEIQCPTEALINDRREWELAHLGFVPLLHRKGTDRGVFRYLPACSKRAAALESFLAVSRVMHYLKSIVRDKVPQFASATECQEYLNNWLAGYLHAGAADDRARAKYPLAEAHIEVREIAGRPGSYTAVATVKPQFQFHPPLPELKEPAWLETITVNT